MKLRNKYAEILRDDQIQRIKERVQHTTPGLWLTNSSDKCSVGTLGGNVIAKTANETDARFIAFSKYTILKLIAEIERLQQKEPDTLTVEVEQMSWEELLRGLDDE